jgi:hypothetical protein
MASELEKLIASQLAESQSKYTYFLLAAAASAIALVVKRTAGTTLNLQMIPLGLAVVCWGWSFFSGCRNRAYFNSTLYANAALLKIQNGNHPEVPNHLEYIEAACNGVRSAAENNSSKANFWGHMQFRSLVTGAIFFLIWHVIGMLPK